jgi:hypothetical protein
LGYSGKFPTCERNGVDQGVHNVLIHTDALGLTTKNDKVPTRVKIWRQGDSPVANMQAHVATLRSNNQQVFNSAGKRVAVVHQYDRYPELQKFLFSEVILCVSRHNCSDVSTAVCGLGECERLRVCVGRRTHLQQVQLQGEC